MEIGFRVSAGPISRASGPINIRMCGGTKIPSVTIACVITWIISGASDGRVRAQKAPIGSNPTTGISVCCSAAIAITIVVNNATDGIRSSYTGG